MSQASASCANPMTPKPTVLRRAELYRDGLMIALLAARPIRIKNFLRLRIETSFVAGPNGYTIVLAKKETKNRKALEYYVPAELRPYLDRYLTEHRPILM